MTPKERMEGGEPTKGNGFDTAPLGSGSKQASSSTANSTPSGSKTGTAATGALEQAKESATGLADQAIGTVKEKASSLVDEKKTTFVAGLTSIADELRRTGESLKSGADDNQLVSMGASYGESIANKVEGLSRYLEEKDLKQMASDLETYARQNPAFFVGGAFLLGFAATRFIKSSKSGVSEIDANRPGGQRNNKKGQGQPSSQNTADALTQI